MKRVKIELVEIAEMSNLVLALQKAIKGKRQRQEVANYLENFDFNLSQLSRQILSAEMPLGHFREFQIYDPKKRLIHAACFEDRVFHHAVINLAGTVLETAMTESTYACRPNKGVHKAVQQVQHNLQRYQWYVKIDIATYFASVEHDLLISVLQSRFKGSDFIKQLQRIISCHQSNQAKGLPIGSLTFCQLFFGWPGSIFRG